MMNKNITPIAVTNWRDIRKQFGIKEKNRRGHIYIIGKTGTGKSSLIANMAKSDINNGYGLGLIDPHGDLASSMLEVIPKNRIEDVIYFDAGDIDHPISFNPISNIHPKNHYLVTSGLLSVFKKIWSEFWGPRLEHILRNSILALLEYPGATLLNISPLLTQKNFRIRVLSYVMNEAVRSFWINEFEKYSAWLKSEAVAPILNKLSQFLASPVLRGIVGQSKNKLKFRRIIDTNKILIVNLAKGKIGEDNCSLIGSMLSTMIYLAALSRVDLEEDKRKTFYLYVDEFHNFISLSFAGMLSESRKYALSLVIAHQYIKQLNPDIRDAIFGNVGTLISFRVGIDDANYLANEFSPTFNIYDIINLPNYHIYLKLMIDNITSKPFSATTIPFEILNESYKNKIIQLSRSLYNGKNSGSQRVDFLTNNDYEENSSEQLRLF